MVVPIIIVYIAGIFGLSCGVSIMFENKDGKRIIKKISGKSYIG